jgi:hypothetical protein
MRRARFLILLGAIGCGIFELVPPDAERPSLFVFISAVHGDTKTLMLDALLDVGRDSTGTPHGLADSTLVINDEALLPTRTGLGTPRWLWTKETATSTTPDTLALQFPVMAGFIERFAAARVVIPTRSSGPNVVIAAGEDLRLPVSPLATPPGYLVGSTLWTLRVGPQCDGPGGFQVQGENDHPSEVRVPWEWIEAPAPFALEACFRLIVSYSSEPPSLGSNLVFALDVTWHVSAVAP